MTIAEAAALAGVSPRAVRGAILSGLVTPLRRRERGGRRLTLAVDDMSVHAWIAWRSQRRSGRPRFDMPGFVPLDEVEEHVYRRRLFDRARRGDPLAITALRERFGIVRWVHRGRPIVEGPHAS